MNNEAAAVKLTNNGRPRINSGILTWDLGQLNRKQYVAKNNPPFNLMHIYIHSNNGVATTW